MDMESRIGVLGVNGAGKSTLIKLIRGKLEATLGLCRVNQHARHVLFTQHHIDQLDLTKVRNENKRTIGEWETSAFGAKLICC